MPSSRERQRRVAAAATDLIQPNPGAHPGSREGYQPGPPSFAGTPRQQEASARAPAPAGAARMARPEDTGTSNPDFDAANADDFELILSHYGITGMESDIAELEAQVGESSAWQRFKGAIRSGYQDMVQKGILPAEGHLGSNEPGVDSRAMGLAGRS